MGRRDPDVWAGTLVMLLCAATAVPVLLAQRSGTDVLAGPGWLWWLCFAGFIAALVAGTWCQDVLSRAALLAAFGAQVVLGPVVVLLSARAGWTPILLVVTAALSAYIVGRPITGVIVVGNTLVAGVAARLAGAGSSGILLAMAMYLMLQLLSVLTVISEQREAAARRRLAAAHIELGAVSALLADSSTVAERLRIARDLHDVIGHQVTALALELEVASHRSSPPAAEHVTRARRIAKDLLTDMRATVGELRAATPALGPALHAVVADLSHPRVHLRIDDRLQVDEACRTALVRCVQEIVTNTIRHADAANLWIDVARAEDGQVVLTARDDGRGVRHLAHGNGLTGIRERVEGLGGSVRFSGHRGFEVVAKVPLP